MTAQILDGKLVSNRLKDEIKTNVEAFAQKYGRVPALHVVLVGEDPASRVYVRNKAKAAEKVGIHSVTHKLAATTTDEELRNLVQKLNTDEAVDGILVQLPVPDGLSDPTDLIDPRKDVDGLHPVNAGLLARNQDALVPCTPLGCMRLIEESGVKLKGLDAVVVGRSNLVGKPIAQLLLKRHATVTMAHSRTRDLDALCRRADVLVAAVGRPKMVKGDWVKQGAVVIDVGINRLDDGSLVGDVDFEAAKERAGWITPVPGGVGPMTIAYLLENTLTAALARLAG